MSWALAVASLCCSAFVIYEPGEDIDVVLDMSTLDHQTRMEIPILEYYRVLKAQGILMLAVRVHNGPIYATVTSIAEDQYIFNRSDVQEVLTDVFESVDLVGTAIDSHTAKTCFFPGLDNATVDIYVCKKDE